KGDGCPFGCCPAAFDSTCQAVGLPVEMTTQAPTAIARMATWRDRYRPPTRTILVGVARRADTVSGSPCRPEPRTIPPRSPDGLIASSKAGSTTNSGATPSALLTSCTRALIRCLLSAASRRNRRPDGHAAASTSHRYVPRCSPTVDHWHRVPGGCVHCFGRPLAVRCGSPLRTVNCTWPPWPTTHEHWSAH